MAKPPKNTVLAGYLTYLSKLLVDSPEHMDISGGSILPTEGDSYTLNFAISYRGCNFSVTLSENPLMTNPRVTPRQLALVTVELRDKANLPIQLILHRQTPPSNPKELVKYFDEVVDYITNPPRK